MRASFARIAPALVLLTALASLAAAALPVVQHLRGRSAALPEQPSPPGAPAPAAEGEPPDLGPILDFAPFGTVEVAPPPEEEPLVETTLDLVLRGVLLQEDPDNSMAFIQLEGNTLGYRPGEAVSDRARLVEVSADKAVLEVDGTLQTLAFPDPAGEAGSDATAGDVNPPPDDAETFADEAQALSGPERLRQMVASQTQDDDIPEDAEEPDLESVEAAVDVEPETVQDQLDLWRERIRTNPPEVLDSIGLIPVDNGYRISEQHDSSVDSAGLQAGDVITSVNGQAVGDVDRDRQLFDEVVASGQARIEVQRDGRAVVLTFPLQ